MTNNRSTLILIAVIIIFAAGFLVSLRKIGKIGQSKVDSFGSCISAGFPVVESFPRKCIDGTGNTFVEEIKPPENAITNEKVHVFYPTPGIVVASPIPFSGEARGAWYFEGTFPVEVEDLNGRTVAKSIARASKSWTTENFVPFDDVIAVPLSVDTGNLLLVFKKDNPSGDPTKDEKVVIPIKYVRR